MPRAGWKKPESDRRLSDAVSIGLLTSVFPAAVVDAAVESCGRTQQRVRALPARVVAYFAVGMGLYSQGSYEDVFAQLTDGLSWASGWRQEWKPPTKSAIFQARTRLGFEPVEAMFRAVARPLATAETPGAWLAGRRLVAVDGTCLDAADTPVNVAEFGKPGVNKGEQAAFPLVRVVGLVECGTHALFDAEIGPYTTSETEMARVLVQRLAPGTLLLADRGFYGYDFWNLAAMSGADLLWRVKSNVKPVHVETLSDGSWLATVLPGNNAKRTAAPVTVRVIDYTIDDGRTNDTVYRLFTTILDPTVASAEQLAGAYAERWEIESVFDELKSHQRGPRLVLRSKSPDLVKQEIWGYLCCHYAIRTLMWEAAHWADVDPDRVSFIATLRIVRRSISAARDFPPSPAGRLLAPRPT